MKHRKLKRVREQLDETLQVFVKTASIAQPIRGWIRAIRDALGMNMRQLAHRLGVSQSRIVKIEQDELSGALTIKPLENIARAIVWMQAVKADKILNTDFMPASQENVL